MQDVSFSSPKASLDNLTHQFNSLASKLKHRAIAIGDGSHGQHQGAVTGAEDTVEVSQEGNALAKLNTIVQKLNQSATAEGAATALMEMRDFLNSETGAVFGGAVMDQLSGLVEASMAQLNNSVGSDFVAISFDMDFKSMSLQNGPEMNISQTRFSFDFSFSTSNTQLDASIDFSEKMIQNGGNSIYMMKESAAVQFTSYSASFEDNPAAAAFSGIQSALADAFNQISGNMLEEELAPSILLPLTQLPPAVANERPDATPEEAAPVAPEPVVEETAPVPADVTEEASPAADQEEAPGETNETAATESTDAGDDGEGLDPVLSRLDEAITLLQDIRDSLGVLIEQFSNNVNIQRQSASVSYLEMNSISIEA